MQPIGGLMDNVLGMNPPPKMEQARPVPLTTNPLPPPPSVDDADTKARLAAAEYQERSKRKTKTQTILTSAQGVLGQAPTAVKALFGD